MKKELTIVKVGGAVVEDEGKLSELLKAFCALPGFKLLVHGGGRSATALSERLGIPSVMVDGRRVTDDAMLEVVTMVYGGLVNKNIVAKLQALGLNALGLTGADLGYMLSDKRPVKEVDYGWVGDVRKVDSTVLSDLISKGVVPVLAPLTHDGKGNMLNTNADTIASNAAAALAGDFKVTLAYCFEMPGVMKDGKVVSRMDKAAFEAMKADGSVSGGMIPKLSNAFDAIAAGVDKVLITDMSDLKGQNGTTIQ
ncbi:MAG: acetylglutamate kinase [Bacteroidales bacterium]|nr:acetylglutamate kinase [Bacteroidales bacterium]